MASVHFPARDLPTLKKKKKELVSEVPGLQPQWVWLSKPLLVAMVHATLFLCVPFPASRNEVPENWNSFRSHKTILKVAQERVHRL